jgi:Zn-dependent protease with chaperone function
MFKRFMDNQSFHDPLRPDGTVQLLSRKERFKGQVVPWAIQLGILGLSVGIVSVLGGPLVAAASALTLIGVSACTNIKLNNWLLRLPRGQRFNFAHPEDDKRSFKDDLGATQPDLAHNLPILARRAGLATIPVVEVREDDRPYTATALATIARRENRLGVLAFGTAMLRQPPKTLLAIAAHETGHVKLWHAAARVANNTLSLANTLLAIEMMGMQWFSLRRGVAYLVMSKVLSGIMEKKREQYQERQADRFVMVTTGFAQEFGRFFRTCKTENHRPSPLYGLTYNHPPDAHRATDFEEFANRHPEYCAKTAAQFNFAAPKPAPVAQQRREAAREKRRRKSHHRKPR